MRVFIRKSQKEQYVLLVTILAFAAMAILSSCSMPGSKIQEYSETRLLMGTTVSVTFFDTDQEHASRAMDHAFAAMEAVGVDMDKHTNDSELSRLNRLGSMDVSPELLLNIKKALYYSNISDGAFDITIEPVLRMWDRVKETQKMPTPEEINDSLQHVGWWKVNISENTVTLQDGMAIDLGGIAKGYAVDKGIESLQKDGINDAIINAGGNMRTMGSKLGEPWTIALQNPRNSSDYITLIEVYNASISTSGDYERYFFLNQTKVIHIADPRTGMSAQGVISVTIVTSRGSLDSDALSTAVFVLGEEKGMQLIDSLDDVSGLIITQDREIHRSDRVLA